MSATFYPDGVDPGYGDPLLHSSNLHLSGSVWYVSPATGDDGNAGDSRSYPYATLSAAVTDAASNDIIVLLDDLELGADLTIAKTLSLIGDRKLGADPAVEMTFTPGSTLTWGANGCEMRNLIVGAHTADDATNARIHVGVGSPSPGGHGFFMKGCIIRCSEFDGGDAVSVVDQNYCQFVNCQFVNVASSATPRRSGAALKLNNASFCRLLGCIFDGGTIGFADGALHGTTSALPTLRVEQTSLLRGADIRLHASTEGWVQVTEASYDGEVDWL